MSNDFQINYSTGFTGIRVIGKTVFATKWTISSEVIVTEDVSGEEINISFNKLDYFFNTVSTSIFFCIDNKWAEKAFRQTNNNLVVCPTEPSDENLVLMFQCKMNALSEGGVHLGSVKLLSDTSGGLEFIFHGDGREWLPPADEWLGDVRYFPVSWWMRNDLTTRDERVRCKGKMDLLPPWYAGFDVYDEVPKKKKAEVLRPIFKPVVIDGIKE